MATKVTVGSLIKEARTNAGLTQEALAKKIAGLSASDISKAERGEMDLTQDQLKSIAKITGVTQKSLLDAAKSTSSKKTTAKKTEAKKTESKKTETETYTAAEKKIVKLYREADSDTKSLVKSILEGKASTTEVLLQMLGKKPSSSSSSSSSDSGLLGNLLGSVLGSRENPGNNE